MCQVAGLGYLFGDKVLPKVLNPCAKVASSTRVSYTSKPVISSLARSLTREVGMSLRLMSRKWYREQYRLNTILVFLCSVTLAEFEPELLSDLLCS